VAPSFPRLSLFSPHFLISLHLATSKIINNQTQNTIPKMSSKNAYQDLDSSRDSQEDSQLLDTTKLEEAMALHKATVRSPNGS
jgi:hypothetical protein